MPAPPSEYPRILDALIRRARPVIRQEFAADSCIASTRLGLDVLDYFHIPAREYPILALLFNPEAVALLEQGVSLEDVAERTRAIAVDAPGGPWSVGLGATPASGGRPNGWSGHLIIGSPDLGFVADLSVDQASRPHKHIEVAPYWAPLSSPDWFTNPTAREVLMAPGSGVLMVLDRAGSIDPQGYLRSPNWNRRSGDRPASLYRRITGQIIRAIRTDLNI